MEGVDPLLPSTSQPQLELLLLRVGWTLSHELLKEVVQWLATEDISCPLDLVGLGDVSLVVGIIRFPVAARECLTKAIEVGVVCLVYSYFVSVSLPTM